MNANSHRQQYLQGEKAFKHGLTLRQFAGDVSIGMQSKQTGVCPKRHVLYVVQVACECAANTVNRRLCDRE